MMTYTMATLVVSSATYREIADKMRAAGYTGAFGPFGRIDMHGIALAEEPTPPVKPSTRQRPVDNPF